MKKSSTDNRSGNLEDVFRTGFGEAEVNPSANLWDRIDKQLDTVEQASAYKKKAIFYGRLVLLSALLLLLVGGAWFYQYQRNQHQNTSGNLAQANPAQPVAKANAESAIAGNQGQVQTPETNSQTPKAADYSAKPAENTSYPTQPTAQENTATQQTAKSAANQSTPIAASPEPETTTNLLTGASSPAQSAKRRNGGKAAISAQTAGSARGSARTQISVKNTSGQNTQIASATGKPANAGQQANSAGLPGQIGAGSSAVTPPTQTQPAQTEPAAPAKQTNALSLVTEVQALPVITPQTAGNLTAQPDSTAKTTPLTEQPLVVIPATTASDSVATAFGQQTPDMKGAFTFSVLYAGYQFEQGLVVSNTVPGAAPPSAAYRLAAQEFNELAKPADSYRAEIRAAYWFHEKLRLETGLGFSRNRALTVSTYEIRSFIFNPGSGNMELATQSSIIEPVLAGAHRDSVAAVSVPEFETSYQYDYLTLPLRVTYQSDTHGWHWFASGGVSAARLLSSRISSTRTTTTGSETRHAFRSWNVAGVFSFGLGYQFNQRISLGIGPDLSYSLNSLMNSDKAGIRQANPYTVGVSGGVSYTFR